GRAQRTTMGTRTIHSYTNHVPDAGGVPDENNHFSGYAQHKRTKLRVETQRSGVSRLTGSGAPCTVIILGRVQGPSPHRPVPWRDCQAEDRWPVLAALPNRRTS